MWLPKDSSGMYPTSLYDSSRIAEKWLMSANTTGMPSSGEDVPILPGTIRMAVLSLFLQYVFTSLITLESELFWAYGYS